MESNKIQIGGYDTHNLSDNSVFFASKQKKSKISFIIHNIVIINDSEIFKILLKNKFIIRIMKFKDEETQQPSLVIDFVDTISNQIKFKPDKIFYNGVGVGGFLFELNYISQWEIPIVDKLLRSFVIGSKEDFLEVINTYNLFLNSETQLFIETHF